MEITDQIHDNIVALKIDGKFNIDFIEKFDRVFYDYVKKEPKTITVDLYDIEYIDSSALGSLIKAMNTAKKHEISFYLFNLRDNIHSVFKLSYLDKFFNIMTQKEMRALFPDSPLFT